MKKTLFLLATSRTGLFGALVVAFFLVTAVLSPILAPYDPVAMDLRSALQPPLDALTNGEAPHVFGTDQLGRDILSRVIAGSRVTLSVAAAAVIIGGLLGVTLGLVSGYFGGWPERLIMRAADVQMSIPLMLFAMLVVSVLGTSYVNLVAVLALTGWTRFARVVRGEVLSLREREFVLASRAGGAGALRIILRHILPNVATAIIIIGTLEFARVVILESALSFLGMGVPPPAASWGRMLAEGRGYIGQAWWLSFFPGVTIALVVLGMNMLGDWLRDYFDPRLSGRK